MRVRRLLLTAAQVLSFAAAAHAGRIDDMLATARTPAALRATLLAFAASAPDSATGDKGAALLHAGRSYEESGRADSALICFERAVAMRGDRDDRDAYVDALLDRAHPGDGALALEVLGPRLKVALTASERDIGQTRGRQAWAQYLMNRGDSALSIMRSQQRWLLDPVTPRHRDWRYRLALAELEHGDPSKCIDVMYPLSIESRFQDRDVMSIMGDAAKKSPQSSGLADKLKKELLRIDDLDKAAIAAFRGKRITYQARDGFTVGAIVVPSLRRPARSVVVVMDADELPDSYDSLSAGLTAAGYSLILIEPRGSGWSVSPECPLPSLWRGREEEMRTQVARDVLPALRALAAETKSDTSSYLLIGAMASSGIAAEAATLQRAPRAMVLLSPSPTRVEVGPMRAKMAKAGMPVFFEVPIMDHTTAPIAQTLYEGVDPRTSRISESDIVGSSAKIFRYDRTALPRLLTWLNESWKRSSSNATKRTKG